MISVFVGDIDMRYNKKCVFPSKKDSSPEYKTHLKWSKRKQISRLWLRIYFFLIYSFINTDRGHNNEIIFFFCNITTNLWHNMNLSKILRIRQWYDEGAFVKIIRCKSRAKLIEIKDRIWMRKTGQNSHGWRSTAFKFPPQDKQMTNKQRLKQVTH